MRTLVSNLTAVLLVIHAMIGCCHHHWHCDDECAAATVNAAPCHCCDHHSGSHDEGELPSSPCNGERECHGVCTYLPTQKTVIDASNADAAFDFAAILPTTFDCHLAAARLPWDRALTLNVSPPLRLHLMHQSLLI